MVFWLLSMLATRDQEDTARTLLAMSSSPESCVAMRRSGCLPLLLQILHGTEAGAGGRDGSPGATGAKDARMRANAALHNIVFSQPDQGLARKEMRVLHVLEQIRAYCETCWDWLQARDGAEGGGASGGEPATGAAAGPLLGGLRRRGLWERCLGGWAQGWPPTPDDTGWVLREPPPNAGIGRGSPENRV